MIKPYAAAPEFRAFILDAEHLANELQRFADTVDPDYKDANLSQASLQMHTVHGLLKQIEHECSQALLAKLTIKAYR